MIRAVEGLGPADEPDRGVLERFRHRQRLLLVFAASFEDGLAEAELGHLSGHRLELVRRDVTLVLVPADGLGRAGDEVIGPATCRWLHERFGLEASQFALVLVGKDGTEKLRQTGRADLAEILAAIDAMPMRQQEIRQRGQ